MRTWKRGWLAIGLIVLLVAAACSPVIEAVQPDEPAVEEVQPTEEPESEVTGTDKGDSEAAEEAPESLATIAITVVNDLDIQICELYISPSTDDYWGDNYIGGVLDPGEQTVVTVDATMLDMMAADCLGNQVSIAMQEDLREDYTWYLSQSYLSAPLAEGEGDSTLVVRNDSGVEICWMYISPTTSDFWGNDWLGDESLEAGGERTFYLNHNEYDIQALDCNEDELVVEFGITISEGANEYVAQAVPGPSEDGDAALLVTNTSDVDICWLYISPSSFNVYGPDRLDDNILLAGDEIRFTLESGDWDVQAYDCQNRLMDSRSFSISSGEETDWELSAPADPAAGGNSSLQVINQSGVDVCYLLISPSTASVWGEDWLGSQILPAGSDMTFSLNAGIWDMLALDCDQNVILEQYEITVPDGGGAFTITAQ